MHGFRERDEDFEGTKGRVLPPLSCAKKDLSLGRVDVNNNKKNIKTKKACEVGGELLQKAFLGEKRGGERKRTKERNLGRRERRGTKEMMHGVNEGMFR